MLALLLVALHPMTALLTPPIQKGSTVPWKNSKELARLKDPTAPLEERTTLVQEIAARAQKHGECVELAYEYLDLACDEKMDWDLASKLMYAVRGCAPPNVRNLLLKELDRSNKDRRSRLMLLAAAGWRDKRIDELVTREFLKDPRHALGGWASWFLSYEKYGPGLPLIIERLDGKETDEEALFQLVKTGQSLSKGSGMYPAWKAALRRYASDPRDVLRRAALEYLREHIDDSDLPVCLAAAKHADWSTRHHGRLLLTTLRSAPAVDGLLTMMSREPVDSRLRADCASSLTRLTRQSLGLDVEAWQRWWSGTQRVLPAPLGKEDVVPDVGISDPLFLGTRVSSNRVLLVLDVDDLCERSREDPEAKKRWSMVRDAVGRYLLTFSESASWNVILARKKPVVWKPSLGASPPPLRENNAREVRAAGASRKNSDLTPRELEIEGLRQFLDEELGPRLPTKRPEQKDLGPTLSAVWAQLAADTVLVISDGQGFATGDAEQLDGVSRENRWAAHANSLDRNRGIRVHAFAVGKDAPSLRRLALDLSGEYRHVP